MKRLIAATVLLCLTAVGCTRSQAEIASVSPSSFETSDSLQALPAVTGDIHMIGIPPLCQYPDFPTGCEITSAVMALRYAGIEASVKELSDCWLQKSDFQYGDGGTVYAPHPNDAFIGDPSSDFGFGCYAPVIEKAIAENCPQVTVVNTTGQALDVLCRRYIDNDIPVIVWAGRDMKPLYEGYSWILPNGEAFRWLSNEHCVLLVGYNETHYFFNDPIHGQTVSYYRTDSDRCYEQLGRQSLAVLPVKQ